MTKDYCSEHKLDLDETLTFQDLGVSAFTGDNIHTGRLGAFLKAIEEGKVVKGSCLIVENLDRLSRGQISDALTLFMGILKNGIDIVTLTDKKRFTQESLNNMQDLMISLLYFHRAYDESLQKGKRIRAAWKNKRNNAKTKPLTATCPSWLTFDKETKKFVEDERAVRIVRRIFESSKGGMGNTSIAKKLNQESEPGIGRGKTWHASVVARILTNRAVLGEFQPCIYVTRKKRVPEGEAITGYYPSVISNELFAAVQFRQKARRNSGSGRRGRVLHNLFSPMAKCGFCDASMAFVQKDPRYPELVCDNARRGLGCKYVSYPYAELEKSFLQYVSELDLKSVLTPTTGPNLLAEEIEQTKARIAQIDAKSSNLTDAIADSVEKSMMTPLIKKVEILQTERVEKERHLRVLLLKQANESTPVQKLDDIKTLVAQSQNLHAPGANETRLALREAIRLCVEKIRVWPYELEEPNAERMTWSEKREATKFGYSLTSNIQRVLRCYQVTFKDVSHYRMIYSHPRYGKAGVSMKYRPSPKELQ